MTNHIHSIAPQVAEPVSSSPTPSAPLPEPDDFAGLRNRHDGWTPVRRRAFLDSLSACGCVKHAAAAVGMSVQSAYALRRRPEAAAFSAAWNASLLLARDIYVDAAMDRALHGVAETVQVGGELVERVRHDNRLLTTMIARLDRRLDDPAAIAAAAAAAHAGARDFDALLDAIEAGDTAKAGAIATPAPLLDECWPEDRTFEDEVHDRLSDDVLSGGELTEADIAIVEEITGRAIETMNEDQQRRTLESLAEWRREHASVSDPRPTGGAATAHQLDKLPISKRARRRMRKTASRRP